MPANPKGDGQRQTRWQRLRTQLAELPTWLLVQHLPQVQLGLLAVGLALSVGLVLLAFYRQPAVPPAAAAQLRLNVALIEKLREWQTRRAGTHEVGPVLPERRLFVVPGSP